MQKFESVVGLIRGDEDLIVDALKPRGHILTHCINPNLYSAQCELEHRSDALNALDHARCEGSEQQLGRIKSRGIPTQVRVERHLSLLASRQTAMSINPFRRDMKRKPGWG